MVENEVIRSPQAIQKGCGGGGTFAEEEDGEMEAPEDHPDCPLPLGSRAGKTKAASKTARRKKEVEERKE